mmetsp:Transcript_21990/g.55203  ORF Transcript_21990/g.55203 Transcript_21990/m.55203 type:complete len:133 (-) Transcript_21990:23-421(-)
MQRLSQSESLCAILVCLCAVSQLKTLEERSRSRSTYCFFFSFWRCRSFACTSCMIHFLVLFFLVALLRFQSSSILFRVFCFNFFVFFLSVCVLKYYIVVFRSLSLSLSLCVASSFWVICEFSNEPATTVHLL